MTNPYLGVALPIDYTGQAASNLVVDEIHDVGQSTVGEYNFFVPHMAPFYADSVVLVRHPSGEPLTVGVDYVFGDEFYGASVQLSKRVYTSIMPLDRQFVGQVKLVSYRAVGGKWSVDEERALKLLAAKTILPPIRTYEQIVGLPEMFPPMEHGTDIDDIMRVDLLYANLEAIAAALEARSTNAEIQHRTATGNVHAMTPADIGLGSVPNIPRSTPEAAVEGASNNFVMTPASTRLAINDRIAAVTPTLLAAVLAQAREVIYITTDSVPPIGTNCYIDADVTLTLPAVAPEITDIQTVILSKGISRTVTVDLSEDDIASGITFNIAGQDFDQIVIDVNRTTVLFYHPIQRKWLL